MRRQNVTWQIAMKMNLTSPVAGIVASLVVLVLRVVFAIPCYRLMCGKDDLQWTTIFRTASAVLGNLLPQAEYLLSKGFLRASAALVGAALIAARGCGRKQRGDRPGVVGGRVWAD
jgi:hypothetical protein